MNLVDAIYRLAVEHQRTQETGRSVQEIELWLNDAEATMAELLGPGNEETAKFVKGSALLAEATALSKALEDKLEEAVNHLKSIN